MNSPLDWTIGYCTNVHAGTNIQSITDNLLQYATAARHAAGLDSLGVGLWLPSSAARELIGQTDSFAQFLADQQLDPYTINGFPYDNFHQEVVKQSVYQPAWWEDSRLQYTQQLAGILADLLPETRPLGTISTLPLGWPANFDGQPQQAWQQSGQQLRKLATYLEDLERNSAVASLSRSNRNLVACWTVPMMFVSFFRNSCRTDRTDVISRSVMTFATVPS